MTKEITRGEIFKSSEFLPMNEEDWNLISSEVQKMLSRKNDIEIQKKRISEEIKEIDSILHRLNRQIANKEVSKEAECYFLFDWKKGTKQKFAIVSENQHIEIGVEQVITEQERQLVMEVQNDEKTEEEESQESN